MISKQPKIIVFHPGKQHSFRIATALKKEGLLYKYITTVYDKKSSWLMQFIKLFLNEENRRRAMNRNSKLLDDDDIVLFSTFISFLLLLAVRIDKRKHFARWLNDYVSRRFQQKVAIYAIKHNVDVVIGYDANCALCFDILRKKAPQIKRVMDNAAPNRNYLYKIYNENWDKCGPFVKTFEAYKYLHDKENAQKYAEEIKKAQFHIVASGFSKKSLLYEGVPDKNIFIIPYGVETERFMYFDREYQAGFLNLLFIGEVNQRKGIYQICEAAKRINNPNIQFNIVGAGYEAMEQLFIPYKQFVNFHGTAYFDSMKLHLKENHVLLFPSMGDGFGLVLLEAMAAGMPVIASKNCAGPDLVIDGENGFLINVCDVNELIEKIMYCYKNINTIAGMGMCARKVAHTFTWSNYNKHIVEMIHKISCDE